MRGLNLPLGEWFRVLSLDVSVCPVPPTHILQYLSFLCTLENRWCASPVVMYMVMAGDSICVGPSPAGNLKTKTLVRRYHHFSHRPDYSTSPVGRDPKDYVSHRMCRSKRFSDQKV